MARAQRPAVRRGASVARARRPAQSVGVQRALACARSIPPAAALLWLAACPTSDPADPPTEPVSGDVPVGEVAVGDLLPATLDGDAFELALVSRQLVTVFADNDERAGDLYVMVFNGEGALVAGPGVADYRAEYLNADWGCSTEPANRPPDRPRGCPDNEFIAETAGFYTLVIAAHDGLETTVGYALTAESEGVALRLTPTEVP